MSGTRARPRRAVVVCDLGFGDAGKGRVVDWLVGRLGARWVIRWNGGAQAGHNVVRAGGRHHTFSQLGAGSFHPGVRTFLGPDFVLHPGALLVEVEHLERVGVPDALERVRVSGAARLITPFHQAVGRIRELVRAPEARHGTCGVGVGEAVRDALRAPDEALRAGDMADRRRLVERAGRARKRLQAEAAAILATTPSSSVTAEGRLAIGRERLLLDDPLAAERWAQLAHGVGARLGVVDAAEEPPFLHGDAPLVLEGAQGVLLDEWRGFHPHTTWSRCTVEPALELLRSSGFGGEVLRLGVLRSYAVRHGPGPLPTEGAAVGATLGEPHNGDAGWQGRFRTGWADLPLARYALAVSGGVDALALTHLDAPARLGRFQAALEYRLGDELDGGHFLLDPAHPRRALAVAAAAAHLEGEALLGRQEAVGRALRSVEPRCVEVPPRSEAVISLFEGSLGAPVALASSGTGDGDVEVRHRAL